MILESHSLVLPLSLAPRDVYSLWGPSGLELLGDGLDVAPLHPTVPLLSPALLPPGPLRSVPPVASSSKILSLPVGVKACTFPNPKSKFCELYGLRWIYCVALGAIHEDFG